MKNGVAIHIIGVIQGVGFRPWVWETARRLKLTGPEFELFSPAIRTTAESPLDRS